MSERTNKATLAERLQWPTNQTEIRKLQPKQLERLLSGWSLDATIHKYQPRRRININLEEGLNNLFSFCG